MPVKIYDEDYAVILLQALSSNHLIAPVQVEHLPLLFLLDTGASHSCIDIELAETLKLPTMGNAEQLTSVTGTQTETINMVVTDSFALGNLALRRQPLMAIDFTHINQRLQSMTGVTVQGILGADLLLALHALIDMADAQLYLKK